MATATLSRLGNSMAVLLPKPLRQQACIDVEDELHLSSPRKGVVAITALCESDEERLAVLTKAEQHIASRKRGAAPWPEGTTAQDMIDEGKAEHAHDIAVL